ncbi:hypothetical protein [Staphylothermus hellenicus]|uniref:GINS subunit domain-containing protein n=1 Tax=Staphylothermus hellenicus (strain DSM 12710 / JCM 10830 / BK20S6-10-b1 / P8) TaxID=591019 RepID=D7D983_STAHD|nr:hypothetical protein [Staphylothermus hellenicus]ADI32329.1 Protein of unknown function DUF1288 [Staphylothermus hellenicus DSM 12710]
MTGIHTVLVDKIIEFIMRDFMEEEVRVEVIGGNFRVLTHEGFIDLVRGAEYNLPRWIAYELLKKGIVNIKSDNISVEKLSSIAYNEESTIGRPEFVKVPRYFYLLVKKEIEEIREKLSKNADINLLQELKTYEDLIYTIGKIRLKKILYILLLPQIPQEILDKLSEEEKTLLNLLKSSLNVWMKSLRIEKH